METPVRLVQRIRMSLKWDTPLMRDMSLKIQHQHHGDKESVKGRDVVEVVWCPVEEDGMGTQRGRQGIKGGVVSPQKPVATLVRILRRSQAPQLGIELKAKCTKMGLLISIKVTFLGTSQLSYIPNCDTSLYIINVSLTCGQRQYLSKITNCLQSKITNCL